MVTLSRSDFVLACEAAKNPAADEIERESAALAEKFGLIHDGNRKRFEAFNGLVPYVYPTASVERAVACAEWCNWLFFFDDVHDEDKDWVADLTRVRSEMMQYLDTLKAGEILRRSDSLSFYTLDFRSRALSLGGAEWLQRFCASAEDYLLKGVLPAVENWTRGVTPPLKDYLFQREHDSAVYTAIDLIEIALDLSLPAEVVRSNAVRRLRRASVRTIAYFNDIVSYPKEVIENKNPNNLVHVLMHEELISYDLAIERSVEITNQFARELNAAAAAAVDQNPSFTREIERYAQGARQWQRGNIEASIDGERYQSEASCFPELRRGVTERARLSPSWRFRADAR